MIFEIFLLPINFYFPYSHLEHNILSSEIAHNAFLFRRRRSRLGLKGVRLREECLNLSDNFPPFGEKKSKQKQLKFSLLNSQNNEQSTKVKGFL